jgi:hypothetical protein
MTLLEKSRSCCCEATTLTRQKASLLIKHISLIDPAVTCVTTIENRAMLEYTVGPDNDFVRVGRAIADQN